MVNLKNLDTEQRNENSRMIDRMGTLQMMQTINAEDQKVAQTISLILPQIANAADMVYEQLKKGGRLIYVGAGTSGRLGILDASECPPTYGVEPTLIQGIIAGGSDAIQNAIEGAEDNTELGKQDLMQLALTANDVVCGLAASGRTPYVIGALQYANEMGAKTMSVSCVRNAAVSKHAMIGIEAVVGAEVVTGSTRMKAGTAQKMILNMLSTAVMIKMGKVYQNLMIDVKASNEKLVERAKQIITLCLDCSEQKAMQLFEQSGGAVKLAILMGQINQDKETCMKLLAETDDNLTQAILLFQKGE